MDEYKILRVPQGTEMTADVLEDLLTKHASMVSLRFKPLQDAYENRYPIYGLPRKDYWKPDNRASVNFAKYIVDTMNGFFIGNPIKVTCTNETVTRYLDDMDKRADIEGHNMELSKILDIHGRGYEMYYVNEASEINLVNLSPMESFMVYDDSILERPVFFVRYYLDANKVMHGSYSDNVIVRHFIKDPVVKFVDEPIKHGFDGVPATEYIENKERQGLFESQLAMINMYNKALCEKANDVDYFADAYLKVLGAQVNQDDLHFIRDNRIVNFPDEIGEHGIEVDFMGRPNADDETEHLLDRLEKLIFMTSMVANISDENFGSASGISLRYKLKAMADLAKVKQNKFISGMNRRYRIIFSNPLARIQGVKPDDWYDLEYHFSLNFPTNVADEAETATKLDGVVSKKTQLSLLSVVADPDKEIEQMQSEESDTMARRLEEVNDFG